MAGVNKAIIIGNLGRDPELRYTQGGQPVCRLAVATSRKYQNKKSQEWVEETEWHRITVWGKQAEHCNTYLAKGRQVYVEGRMKTSKYEKDGQTHYSTEIIADVVQFLSGGGDKGGGGGKPGGYGGGGQGYSGKPSGGYGHGGSYGGAPSSGYGGGQQPAPYDEPYEPSDPGDDDIPF